MTPFPAAKNKIIDRYDREFRAEVAGQIAQALEARAGEAPPAGECDGQYCADCARRDQMRQDAALARQIGGAA